MKLVKNSVNNKYIGHINKDKTTQYHKYLNSHLIRKRPHEKRFYAVVKNDVRLNNYLMDCLRQRRKYNMMAHNRKKLTLVDVQLELRFRLKIVAKRLPDDSLLMLTYSYKEGYFIPLNDMLYKILAKVNTTQDLELQINDLGFAVKQVSLGLEKSDELFEEVELFNPAPTYIIQFRNGVFNNKTKEWLKSKDYVKYHFTKKIDWNLQPITLLNPLYASISRRIINDWSDDNKDKEKLIWQIIVAAIEGDGRNKTIILKSDGGGGKTSFLNILQAIIGLNKTLNCGIYELGNDNKLANLKPSTHIIIGDDADTNKKMPAIALSRLKSLSDGGSFLIDVKYEASRPVMSNALFIQNTNTDIAIYENNQALMSRMVKLNWTNRNFRQKNDLEFDLKELLGNPALGIPANEAFIEAMISIALLETPYFKKFTIPKEVEEDTMEMLAENDQVQAFIDFLDMQGVLQLPYLALTSMHKRYEVWLKDTNPSANPLKIRNFKKEFEHKLLLKGYKLYNDGNWVRPGSLSTLQYNNDVINYLTEYNIEEKARSNTTIFVNEQNVISESSVTNFKELDSVDKFNPIHQMIYQHLAYTEKDVTTIDKFNELMED